MGRFLVTGDAGFIGFHTSQRLLRCGNSVLGIDGVTDYYDQRLKRDRLAQLGTYKHFSHINLMLEHADKLAAIVAEYSPEVVIHLAAQAGVRYGIDNPRSYVSSNLVGTFNLVEALRCTPVEHLLLASTSSVYGGNSHFPFAELDRADYPLSLYAATKKSTEAIAHSYSHLWNIPTTCFRFFTVYGPWGRPDMALFKFVKAIMADDPIDVYGHGNMTRDFTYIEDLTAAVELLAACVPKRGHPISVHDSLSPVAPYRVVNVGGGAPTGLGDFIEAIEAALGRTAQKRFLPMQLGDVAATHADSALLRELIGTIPATPVREGVQHFVDWYSGYYR